MPREEQDTLLHEREIIGFLEQSRISAKNITRLRRLTQSKNERVARLAALTLDVATVAPYRRHRIRVLARERRDVLERLEEAGLVFRQHLVQDIEPLSNGDLLAAWDEWALFANSSVEERETPRATPRSTSAM
jgi:hypothetical protein